MENTVMIRHQIKPIIIAVVVGLLAAFGYAQTSISAGEAKNHIGERATVCGEVASAHYAAKSRGSPTFINLDKPYPNQIFTVLIWGSDRSKFGEPEETYRSKRICVNGKISDYKGIPEIIAHETTQIKVQ
jgi:micrococcal nuclease